MLVLNTQFPINTNASISDLLKLGNKWIRESPHSCMKEDIAEYKNCCDCYDIQKENERFTTIIGEDSGHLLCGMRYKREDKGPVYWTTDVVGVKSQEKFTISIQIYCESKDIFFKPNAKKPYFIKLIYNEVGFANDETLSITDKPKYLQHDQVPLASNIINGKHKCELPCVYVSINNQGEYNLSATDLSRQLLGIAHVIVEPNRYFSYDLQSSTNGRNAYNGAVGVYFSQSPQYLIILPDTMKFTVRIDKSIIYTKIRDTLLLQQIENKFSYSSIANISYNKKINDLERSGKRKLSEYMDNFDIELTEKNEEIAKLKAETEHLKFRLRTQQTIESAEGRKPVIYHGKLEDSYQGETHDAILTAIQAYIDSTPSVTKRKQILQSIIDSNPMTERRDKLAAKIKDLFRGFTSMTPTIKNELQKLGFSIEEGGKHYKLFFTGYPDCFATLPKTGSDRGRGGLNTTRDIIRQLL